MRGQGIMGTKQAAPMSAPMGEFYNPAAVTVRIRGMKEVQEGIFEIQGLTHKERAWDEGFKALGYPDLSPSERDALCEKVGRVLFLHDLTQVLMDRVEY